MSDCNCPRCTEREKARGEKLMVINAEELRALRVDAFSWRASQEALRSNGRPKDMYEAAEQETETVQTIWGTFYVGMCMPSM